MKKIKKPTTAIFYGNYKEMIYNATPEQVKEIMTAFCQYAFDDIIPTVSSNVSLAWGIMKGNIDDDFKQYNERGEKSLLCLCDRIRLQFPCIVLKCLGLL